MPVRKDGDRRWVEMEVLVPGTPEQVWDAIATGPGLSAWFTETTVETRGGGAIVFDFGGGATSTGEVTHWEPPHRLGYVEREWSENAPPVATECTVTARSGGRCVVRMVHSLFTSDEQWDDQMEGFEAGWPGFFEVLRIYLGDFAGAKAGIVRVSAAHGGPEAEAWKTLAAALGLSGADVDDRFHAAGNAPPLAGSVARVHQDGKSRDMMLRLEAPATGVALVGTYRWENQTRAAVCLYLYGDDAAALAARSTPAWEEWIGGLFPG